jgi:hypothetical protein
MVDMTMNKTLKTFVVIFLVGLLFIVILIYNTGFYTIQPIGALPEGVTLVVWRKTGEPFFNSPDAHSIKTTGGVSLLSRGLSMAYAPKDRIILRLPYLEFAYLQSTGGKKFDR